MKDVDEIYLDIWQIMSDSGEIWLDLAGNEPYDDRGQRHGAGPVGESEELADISQVIQHAASP